MQTSKTAVALGFCTADINIYAAAAVVTFFGTLDLDARNTCCKEKFLEIFTDIVVLNDEIAHFFVTSVPT